MSYARLRRCPDTGMKEKYCHKCGEWWPATTEFFWRSTKSGKLTSPCKACIAEQRDAMNAATPCAIPQCDAPRKASRSGRHCSSYCVKHERMRQQDYRRQHETQEAAL